jgi:hypothetical protein
MNCKLQEDSNEALNGHRLTPKIPTFVDKIHNPKIYNANVSETPFSVFLRNFLIAKFYPSWVWLRPSYS